jgi:hypothetical protein
MTLPTWPVTVPTDAREGWQMPEMFLAPIATRWTAAISGSARSRATTSRQNRLSAAAADRGAMARP